MERLSRQQSAGARVLRQRSTSGSQSFSRSPCGSAAASTARPSAKPTRTLFIAVSPRCAARRCPLPQAAARRGLTSPDAQRCSAPRVSFRSPRCAKVMRDLRKARLTYGGSTATGRWLYGRADIGRAVSDRNASAKQLSAIALPVTRQPVARCSRHSATASPRAARSRGRDDRRG